METPWDHWEVMKISFYHKEPFLEGGGGGGGGGRGGYSFLSKKMLK